MINRATFGERLVSNLMALNAKERDHLMRFAYLGQTDQYGEPGVAQQKFLSHEFLDAIWEKVGPGSKTFPKNGKCLFAGMDYHIDWLFAAMFMAARGEAITNATNSSYPRCAREDKKDEDEGAPDLRPILGNQEDVDLLVLLEVNDELHLVFVEAKGGDGFEREQLGRKLVRVSNAIEVSKPDCGWPRDVVFSYVLISARNTVDADGERTYSDYISKSSSNTVKYISDRLGDSPHFNSAIKWIEMKNYPGELYQVQRYRKDDEKESKPEDYTHWKITPRHRGAGKKRNG